MTFAINTIVEQEKIIFVKQSWKSPFYGVYIEAIYLHFKQSYFLIC